MDGRGREMIVTDASTAHRTVPLTGDRSGTHSLEKYLLPRKTAIAFASGLATLSILHAAGLLQLIGPVLASIPLCPFRLVTHMDCPGCGMIRSLFAFAAGDLWKAACFNPFSFVLVFVTGLSLVPRRVLDKEPSGTARLLRFFYVAMLVLALAYWLAFRVLALLPIHFQGIVPTSCA